MKKSLLFFVTFISLSITAKIQNSLFSVEDNYLSGHDIVYLEPDYNGYNGFPLGNGDLGGMLWLTNHGIEMQVNKIDLYDIPEKGRMTLRSAGQLNVDFGIPCFDYLYLKNFEARLSLRHALATIESKTPFSNVRVESWLDVGSNVWVLDCEVSNTESSSTGSAMDVTLGRWGSRDFGGWYGGYSKDVSEGLGLAKAQVWKRDILVTDTFSGGLSFCMACRILKSETVPSVLNDRTASFHIGTCKSSHFQILISVVTSREDKTPAMAAVSLLDKAEQKGIDRIKEEHLSWWNSFWKRSFVHLADDYLENIYYLRRYLMASSSRGQYLAPFNGSLWVWNHDIRQWVTPHHWNTQESYWGLAPENDCDLIKPYIKTYARLMPQAEAYAAARGVKNAILWTEAHDFSGRMVSAEWNNMVNNFTPASQMAAIFWDYYEYTGDKKCLTDTIYPFMKKTAEFYLQYLKWDTAKNEYSIYPSQPYEHEYNNGLKNCITDRYMIESLFKNCMKAAEILGKDREKIKQWKHVVEHLWEPPILEVPGVGEMFGMAFKPDGSLYPSPQNYGKMQFYHFDAHTTAVFPANLLGLDQKGSRYFTIAERIALRHPPYRNAITPGAIVSARLGLADKVVERLHNMVAYLQHFNQGLFYNLDHWNNLSRYSSLLGEDKLTDQRDYIFDERTRYNKPGTGNSGLWTYPFVQCGMETIGIFGTAVNEMLLQSHENKIRLFPATPKDWATAFTLLARGGFRVSACKNKEGFIAGADIESELGNVCRIQNPWPKQKVILFSEDHSVPFTLDKQDVISFKTRKGGRYMLRNATQTMEILEFKAEPNSKPKHCSEAILGKECSFRQ